MKLSIDILMQLTELGWIRLNHNEVKISSKMREIDEPSRFSIRSSNTENTNVNENTWDSNSPESNTTVFAILMISRYLCRSK